MDDSCAVCAEPLEWVAFGPCGHRDICSTCVSRLRFICNDRRCCICKNESDSVFVTKALREYTTKFNDFSAFSWESREGRVGSYWFHLDTHAIFDDCEQYKMVKAMCRLSCSVCERADGDQMDAVRRKSGFRSIDQLKGHLFHQHKLVMCTLCLEGRKVFICEQKLYTRGQLNQHIHTGDSEVDGSESERGGFMGHPICEFCRAPFYGDNELYTHMSTDHFTCHICLREHPGQYEYYKNYSDLEAHFRRDHFLCENEACLAKKFVVFQAEVDMKRHTTLEHGGTMSRSKRNSALQIPTSFRYRRANERDRWHGTGRAFLRDFSEDQMAAIEAGLSDMTVSESPEDISTGDGPLSQEWPSPPAGEPETSSRYRQAVSQSQANGRLGESSFPPLPFAKPGAPPKGGLASPKNTMADHLRRRNGRAAATTSSAPDRAKKGWAKPAAAVSGDPSPVPFTRPPPSREVQTANRHLMERMRASLGFDDMKFGEFRNVSGEYRLGLMETGDYLGHVQRFGLLHLVHDLADLLPDKLKRNELIEAYSAGFLKEDGRRKGKEKEKDKEKEGVVDIVRRLQAAQRPGDEEVEVLSKDGYRPNSGKREKAKKKISDFVLEGGGGGRGTSVWDNRGGQRLIGIGSNNNTTTASSGKRR